MTYFLAIHIICCLLLTGLIWTIQRVHYPSFLWVETSRFTDFSRFHSRRISEIVMPLMLLELFTALALLLFSPLSQLISGLNLLLIAFIWGVTFLVSVPCHSRLLNGRDELTIQRLIRTNWWRTGLWSLRSFGLIYLTLQQN